VSSRPNRVQAWANPEIRQSAVAELRLLVESGQYHVPAEDVADALLAEAGFFGPDSSSWRGANADAD
jgi:anti-sigma28 factor (negative regulator of flagellin synthesis)